MKVTQATLDALFSQVDDSSFSAYLAMETKLSSRVYDLFDDLNKGEQSLAALAIDLDSNPIIILDGHLSNHKSASMVVLTHKLDLKVVLLSDSFTLDKSEVASEIKVTLDPSFFQTTVESEERNTNAASSPACLLPRPWIPFMVTKDGLSLDTLAANLALKLATDESISAEEIANSDIVKDLCNFVSLATEHDNASVMNSLVLGPFSENIERSISSAVERMRESLAIIMDDETFGLEFDDNDEYVPHVMRKAYGEHTLQKHHLGNLKKTMENPMIVKVLNMLGRAVVLGKPFNSTSMSVYSLLGMYIHGILIPCSRLEFGKLLSSMKMFKDQGISEYRIKCVIESPSFYANKVNKNFKTLQEKQDEGTSALPFMSQASSKIFSKADTHFALQSVSVFHHTSLKKRPSLKDRLNNPNIPMYQTSPNFPDVEECTTEDDNDGVFSDDEEGTELLDRSQDEVTTNLVETLDSSELKKLSSKERLRRHRTLTQKEHFAGDYEQKYVPAIVKKTLEIRLHTKKIANLCKKKDVRVVKLQGMQGYNAYFQHAVFIHNRLIGVTVLEFCKLLAATKDYKDANVSEYHIYQICQKSIKNLLATSYMADVSEESLFQKLSDQPYTRLNLSSGLSLEDCGKAIDSRSAFDTRDLPTFHERFENARELESEPKWMLEMILPECQAISDESIQERISDSISQLQSILDENPVDMLPDIGIHNAVAEEVQEVHHQRPVRAVVRRTNDGISDSISQLNETAAEEAVERKRKREADMVGDSDDEDSQSSEEAPPEPAEILLRRRGNVARNLEKLASLGLDTYDPTRDYSK